LKILSFFDFLYFSLFFSFCLVETFETFRVLPTQLKKIYLG
jgi:hypothetical protein